MTEQSEKIESSRVHSIPWREYFPWLCLFRTLGLALRVRLLMLATGGLLLTTLGWWVLAYLFSSSPEVAAFANGFKSCAWRGDASGVNGLFIPADDAVGPHLGHMPAMPFRDTWWKLSSPVRMMFSQGVTFVSFMFLMLCTVWSVLVWAFFGGAISRIAALAMGREETISASLATRFVKANYLSYIGAPLMPLLGVFLVGLPLVIGGLFLRSDFMAVLVALAWPLMLVGGLLIAMFLLGLLFGWPLMFAAVSTEGADSFGALSQSYSFVNQRPLHYLGYAVVATLLGMLGATFVEYFASAVIHLATWMASWGSGNVRMLELTMPVMTDETLLSAKMIWFWNGLVRVVALSFVFSHFWVASTTIYLLLRRDTDGREMDEVQVDDGGDGSESFGLPPVEIDAQGVVVVAKETSGTRETL